MPRLALTKSSLHKQVTRLKTFERFLPSLDLKRRQLVQERAKARTLADECRRELAAQEESVGLDLPMLANTDIDLSDLVRVADIDLGEESLVGVMVPVLRQVSLHTRPYALLARPHWVDEVAVRLARCLSLRLMLQVRMERARRLDEAVRRLTQRVNLFDKVLIPRTREDIRHIRIHLADAERARVVQAKIAKRQRLAKAA